MTSQYSPVYHVQFQIFPHNNAEDHPSTISGELALKLPAAPIQVYEPNYDHPAFQSDPMDWCPDTEICQQDYPISQEYVYQILWELRERANTYLDQAGIYDSEQRLRGLGQLIYNQAGDWLQEILVRGVLSLPEIEYVLLSDRMNSSGSNSIPGFGVFQNVTSRRTIGGVAKLDAHPALSCINAILQALAATSFVKWVDRHTQLDEADRYETKVHTILKEIFSRANQYYSESLYPHSISLTPHPEFDLRLLQLKTQADGDLWPQSICAEVLKGLVSNLIAEKKIEMEKFGMLSGHSLRRHPRSTCPLTTGIIMRDACLECGYARFRLEKSPIIWFSKPPTLIQCSLDDIMEHFIRVQSETELNCRKCISLGLLRLYEHLLNPGKQNPGKRKRQEPISGLSPRTVKSLKRRQRALAKMVQRNKFDEEDMWDMGVPKSHISYPSLHTIAAKLFRMPRVLVLGFLNMTTELLEQNLAKVHFETVVDLDPLYMSMGKGFDALKANDILKPLSNNGNSNSRKKLVYELRSVVFHRGGNAEYGHYVCYRREWKESMSRTGEEWWYCNDGFTMRVRKEDFLGTFDKETGIYTQGREVGNEVLMFYEQTQGEKSGRPETSAGKESEMGADTAWEKEFERLWLNKADLEKFAIG